MFCIIELCNDAFNTSDYIALNETIISE